MGLLKIEDVFNVRKCGIVVTGRWSGESFKVGDAVRCGERVFPVNGIERFCHFIGRPIGDGENIGILLGECSVDDVKRGDILELL